MSTPWKRTAALWAGVLLLGGLVSCGGEPVDEPAEEGQEAYVVSKPAPAEPSEPRVVENLRIIDPEGSAPACGTPIIKVFCLFSCEYCRSCCTDTLPQGQECLHPWTRLPCP